VNQSRVHNSEEFVSAATDLAMEANILSRLNHRNIIRLRGLSSSPPSQSYSKAGEGYFLLMDVLEGTLKEHLQRLRNRRRSFRRRVYKLLLKSPRKVCITNMYDRIQTIAWEIAQGMKYLHQNQILMCDLKPGNIGFDKSGTVKLFDFGMAQEVDDGLDYAMRGTPRYMAPEVILGDGCSFKSDVYSFGVVLYELCSLQIPFSKCTNLETCRGQVVMGERPSLDCIPCPSIKVLIQACWASNPRDRPSFEQICNQLLDAVRDFGLREVGGVKTKTIFASERTSSTSCFEEEENSC
jgi:serine/threonine protein kinase